MTLIVSVRCNDGIILAADDLATEQNRSTELRFPIETKCPNCNQNHSAVQTIVNRPSTIRSRSRAVKVIPFLGRFGLGFSGLSHIGGRSLNWLIPLLEKTITNADELRTKPTAEVGKHLAKRLAKVIGNAIKEKTLTAEDSLHFQIAGYDEYEPIVCMFRIGASVKVLETYTKHGCSLSGDYNHIISIMNHSYNEPFNLMPAFDLFSIYDAMEYAQFLIRTASAFQEFSSAIPTIGSGIRMSQITPLKGFEWVLS